MDLARSRRSNKDYYYHQAIDWYLQIKNLTDKDYQALANVNQDLAEIASKLSDRSYYCVRAINWYLGIKVLTAQDHRAIAEIYRKHAVACFNANDNQQAADYFWRSKEQLLQINLDDRKDSDYRELTITFLDLADTCYFLLNQQAVDEATENALQAFELIKIKNPAELTIGDPRSPDRFPLFFKYFQNESSEYSYMASADHQNHAHILQATHAKRVEEQSMADLFAGICIDDVNKGLGDMMNQLVITNVSKPSFAPISLKQPQNDVAYRSLAIDFLAQTQSHIQQCEISNTILTYKEALRALHKVRDKSQSDQQIISTIEQQIRFLTEKIECYPELSHENEYSDEKGYDEDDDLAEKRAASQALPEQNQQVTSSLIANIKMSMFGRTGQIPPGASLAEPEEFIPPGGSSMDLGL